MRESKKPLKVQLAYEIRKQTHAWNGNIVFGIEQNNEKFEAIKSFIAANQNVLRYACFRTDNKVLTELRQRRETSARPRITASIPGLGAAGAEKATPRIPGATVEPQKEEKPKPKVEMKDVEEKLEELLK